MLNISNFPWAECTISEERVNYRSDSLSLRRTTRDTGIMRYAFELVTIDMDWREGRRRMAQLSKENTGTLLFVHPRLSYADGIFPAVGLGAVGTKGTNTITVETLSGIDPWQILAGSYISFANHTKVYQVAEDTEARSTAQQVVLTSPLMQNLSGDQVIVSDVTWYLEPNGTIEASMEASDNQDIMLVLEAVEKL